MATVVEDLHRLHSGYVDAVNRAVETGDRSLVAELASTYERDVDDLMVAHDLG